MTHDYFGTKYETGGTRSSIPRYLWTLSPSSIAYDSDKAMPRPLSDEISEEEVSSQPPESVDAVVRCSCVGMPPSTANTVSSARTEKNASLKQEGQALRVVIPTASNVIKFYALLGQGGIDRPFLISNNLVFYSEEFSIKCPLPTDANRPRDKKRSKQSGNTAILATISDLDNPSKSQEALHNSSRYYQLDTVPSVPLEMTLANRVANGICAQTLRPGSNKSDALLE